MSLLTAMLSGCVSDGLRDTDAADPGQTGGGNATQPQLPAVTASMSFVFDSCETNTVAFSFPTTAHPGSTPPGWEPDQGSAVVTLSMNSCERARIGPFERALDIVTESHGNGRAPASCPDDGSALAGAFIGVSDPEIRAWLANATGLDIQLVTVAATGASDVQIGLSLQGAEILTGTIRDHQLYTTIPLGLEQSMFAAKAGGVWINMTYDGGATAMAPLTFAGSAQAPLLLGQAPDPFTGTSVRIPSGTMTWEATTFADMACN